jgi:hypothetical protein
MRSDPNFRKEKPRYFPSDSVNKRIEWQKENSGYDLYEPKRSACHQRQLLEILRQAGLLVAGHHGAAFDSVQHSYTSGMVG